MAATASLLSVAAFSTPPTKADSHIGGRSYGDKASFSGRAGRSKGSRNWIPLIRLQRSAEKRKIAGLLSNDWNTLHTNKLLTKMQAKEDTMTDLENENDPLLLPNENEKSWDFQSVLFPFFFPALGGLLFGYDIGATSGSVLSLTSPELSGTTWYALSSVETGLVVSGSLYGALLGSILAFNVADSLGRRRELILSAVIYAVGSSVTGLAPNLAVLIGGRLVYGVAIGLAMHAAPCYISETSPSDIRGTLISLKEALIVLGILLGYLVGSLEISTVGGWRLMFGAAVPLAAVMGLGMLWLPPSPRWLLLRAVQGKLALSEAKERAGDALSKLRGTKKSSHIIDAELEETLSSVEAGAGGQGEITFGELFQGNLNRKALFIGGGLVFLQQVTGQPSVLYYAASILQSAGFSAAADATNVSVILGTFKLVMTCVAVLYVDKTGRRPLLIGGVSGIVLALLLLAAYYSFASGVPALAVGALLLYVGSYQVSFGPISWLMVSEVFPLRTRGKALSLTTLINFTANALVAFAFAPLQDLVGVSATFLLFGAVGIGALFFVISQVPETKGLSLEQIEAKLSE
ncbi:hypothetical protein R1sor_001410 [Riccia sorocarpa]|uniref:Major facilitator superfamily (MFS) profile domain-containing protein n=1 Tax=Riccia sorocarpa TaxID=122646 RepID=A0ABD3GVX5_9MARC